MASSKAVEQQLIVASKIIEESVDAEIARLDNLEEDDLEVIRRDRLAAMKKRAQKKNEWIANGHGDYSELYDEKEFFEASKKSENFVCHFYRDDFERCRIVDKHFTLLSKKHIETKFCKINAGKAPFLTDRLKIRVLPTIVIIKDSKAKDYIVGFTDLGNVDDFPTEMMEWRLGTTDVIEYSGDLLNPPSLKGNKHQVSNKQKTKIIRGKINDDTDSD